MRKGEPIELDVDALDGEGAGLGTLGELRLHVAGALPGERVCAQVEHLSPHRSEAWARLTTVERPAPERTPPACPAYGSCGGCALEHLDYRAQLAFKTGRLREAMARLPAPPAVDDCVASPHPLGYRNLSKLVYGRIDGRAVLGAYAPRSHRLVDLAGCRVSEPPLDEVATALAALCHDRGPEPYEEASASGTLRYALLRSNRSGEVLVVLVSAAQPWAAGEELARALMRACPAVIGVVENSNPTRGNRLTGDEERTLAGRATLDDQVGAVTLRLSATAFFQVNRGVAERLYADVREAAQLTGSERVVDGYTGVGGIALTLASGAGEVVGIEAHTRAVADAESNRAIKRVANVRFVCADIAAGLAGLDGADVIVLNPPRRGCELAVLDSAVRLAPRTLLYVSCSPETLARDLALLDARGYRAERVRPYDMLPQTPHVEALAVLRRA